MTAAKGRRKERVLPEPVFDLKENEKIFIRLYLTTSSFPSRNN
jgi:hypothetical protein